MSDDSDLLILSGKRFWKQGRWAADKGITARTAQKYREQGLLWLEWAGQIWIAEDEGDTFILARLRRPNPPRRRRRQASATAEINA